MSALAFELPDRLEAHAPARRARRRAHARRAGAATGRSSMRASARCPTFLEPGDLARRQHVGDAARRAAGCAGRRARLHLSTPVPDGPEPLGRRAAPRRRSLPGGGRRLRRSSCPAGPRATVLAPYLARPRLWVARPPPPATVLAYLAAHGRPIRYRYVRERVPARRLPDRLRDRARQRRDAERRPPVHRRARDRARRTRHRRRAGRPPHGRVVARGRRAAVPGAVPRAARRPRARSRRRAPAAAA